MVTKRPPSQQPHQNWLTNVLLISTVLTLVVGSLVLAVIDPSFRPNFAELSKLAVAGYIGSLVPRSLANQ